MIDDMRITFILFSILWYIFSPSELISEINVCFSPEQQPSKCIIEHINKTKKDIKIAVYLFTHKKIAQALIAAMKANNINVQIVTDQANLNCRNSQIELLKNLGADLFLYAPKKKSKRHKSLMHHKFALFDQKYLITGSFNWTWSADKKHQEHILVICNHPILKKFSKQFELLKKRCYTTQKTEFYSKKTQKKGQHRADAAWLKITYLFNQIKKYTN